MIKKILPAVLIFITLVSCGPTRRSIAIEDGWDLLGEQKVNFVRDKDVVDVHSSSKFTAIRFKVEGKEVRLNGLKIHFQNGDKLEPALDDIIAADQYSKEIELSQDGKYMLRAFNKNQFEVILDGYVVETGLAFIVTMDYEKFSELASLKNTGNQ